MKEIFRTGTLPVTFNKSNEKSKLFFIDSLSLVNVSAAVVIQSVLRMRRTVVIVLQNFNSNSGFQCRTIPQVLTIVRATTIV